MKLEKRKIVIIGCGHVGVSTAFCLINQGLCDEIALIDLNEEKVLGEVLDLSQSIEYMNRNTHVKVDDMKTVKMLKLLSSQQVFQPLKVVMTV